MKAPCTGLPFPSSVGEVTGVLQGQLRQDGLEINFCSAVSNWTFHSTEKSSGIIILSN